VGLFDFYFMATLKEIAQALNLSVMAVSKALRDAPDISSATKTRVLAEAQKRQYVPNQAARNLRTRQTRLLGVVVPNINNSYYANLVWGIERQAETLGFQLLLSHSLDQADCELTEVGRLLSQQVEGILLVPAVRWQNRFATLERLRQASVPVVMLDRYPAGAEQFSQASWVVTRNQYGVELATGHLLELGHKEILYFSGPNGSSSSAARFSGYQTAMMRSTAGHSDSRVFLAGDTIDAGRKAMLRALSEEAPFTALVTFNDLVAIGAAEVLEQQGFRIPSQVSLIGFGDGMIAEHFRVPLTTVHVPQIELGTNAVLMLNELLDGKHVDPRELPVELVVRYSTAKMKA
jgi:LacI family transcriptional regulator